MSSATDPGPAEGAGGEGWAKTVVDGVAEREAGESRPNPEPPTESTAGAGEGAREGAEHGDEQVTEHGDGAVDPDQGDPSDPSAVAGGAGDGAISVEDLVADLERVSLERDQYLDTSRRIQAEFENYKKQVAKREAEARERANDSLIGELLPVLDAFDGALANGASDVAPMRTTFLDALGKRGLERIDPDEGPFDPNVHESVMHDDDAETDGPIVAEVLRAGYVWKGRVLRPAMVKTRG